MTQSKPCADCHGNDGRGGRVGEGVRGESANSITEAIREKGSMQFLGCLSPAEIQLTATFLSSGKPGNDSSGGDGGAAAVAAVAAVPAARPCLDCSG